MPSTYEPKPIVFESDAKRDQPILGRVKLERRIVLSMIEHLVEQGFVLVEASDGEERIKPKDNMEAMEHVFGVDESHLYFQKPGFKSHWIFLVHGNGVDIISDYSFTNGDPDGWCKVMDVFNKDVERFE